MLSIDYKKFLKDRIRSRQRFEFLFVTKENGGWDGWSEWCWMCDENGDTKTPDKLAYWILKQLNKWV